MSIRSRALTIFRDFLEILFMMKDEHPEIIYNYLDPIFSSWMDAFHLELKTRFTQESLHLRLELMRVFLICINGPFRLWLNLQERFQNNHCRILFLF